MKFSPRKILAVAEEYYGTTVPLRLPITNRRPGRPEGRHAAKVTLARHIVAYLCYHHSELTLGQISRMLGITHWTTMYAEAKIGKLLTEDEAVIWDVDNIMEELKNSC